MKPLPPPENFIKCPKCGAEVRSDRLEKHTRKVHGSIPQNTQIISTETKVKSPKNKLNHTVYEKQYGLINPRSIRLKSKRRTRLKGGGRCNVCGVTEPLVWLYANSNHGTIQICSRCIDDVLDHSFGKIDMADIAYEGGAIETDPRKH